MNFSTHYFDPKVRAISVLTLASLLTICFLASSSHGQQNGREYAFNLGYQTSQLASGDIFGSPAPDLVLSVIDPLTQATFAEIAVMVNEGPCNTPTSYFFPVVSQSRRLTTLDIDGDGDVDIVTVGGSMVSVLVNQGPSSLSFVRTDYALAGVDFASVLSCGDLDGDGDIDLALGRTILPGLGGGAFGTAFTLASPSVTDGSGWIWADFDGDGDADLAGFLTNQPTPTIGWWETDNGPASTFRGATIVSADPQGVGGLINRLIAVDFDQDGAQDLLVTLRNVDNTERSLLMGDANNPFSAPLLAAPSSEEAPELGQPQGFDLDGDGARELIAYSYSAADSPVVTSFNFSPTGFTPSTVEFPALSSAYAVEDFDGDGSLDIATTPQFGLFPPTIIKFLFGGSQPIYTLAVVNGAGNPVLVNGGTLFQPIDFELRNCFGNPATFQSIRIDNLPSGVSIVGPTPLETDASGLFTLNLTSTGVLQDFEFSVSHQLSNSVEVTVDVQPSVIMNFVTPPLPFVMLGRETVIEVQVLDEDSLTPIAGMLVNAVPFTNPTIAGFAVLGAPYVTDANGKASIRVLPTWTNFTRRLIISLDADADVNLQPEFFLRGLRMFPDLPDGTPLSIITLQYVHENAGLPFILAADTPLPAPGFVTTSFGDIYTSVLNPQPSLAILDGNLNPAIQTPLNFLPISLPPGLAGMSFAIQAYGVDPNYASPNHVFISNPVFLVL